ncbi:MAG: hypothetical protein J1E95_11025 [Muribaculaceae bacterium]|nr:hypothetical protein [Muribaculaceae bacterium]
MSYKKIINAIFLATMFFVSTACNEEDVKSSVSYPSYRDGTYEGKYLTVTLDGKTVASVKSVSIKSELIDTNVNPDSGPESLEMDPIYNTRIMVVGFPVEDETIVFRTVSDLQGFEGITRINNTGSAFNNTYYRYKGTFTGDPLTIHDKQGLILAFSTTGDGL